MDDSQDRNDIPGTREEALAAGFKPVENLDALIQKSTGKSAEKYFHEFQAELATIDCNNPANEGKHCRVIDDGHGGLIVLFCHNLACSQKSALYRAAQE
jgi:hypothetical protein